MRKSVEYTTEDYHTYYIISRSEERGVLHLLREDERLRERERLRLEGRCVHYVTRILKGIDVAVSVCQVDQERLRSAYLLNFRHGHICISRLKKGKHTLRINWGRYGTRKNN